MRLYSQDDMVVRIYNIRNIESINIYDMFMPKSTKLEVVPALIIIYDGGQTINLCARDKYFDLLIKKVTQVYSDEKNNVLEDSLSDPFRFRSSIKIDDHTKKILESGVLLNVSEFYKFYENKKSYDASLLFENDEINMLINIIKYHLKDFFSHTDQKIKFDKDMDGYKSNYMLTGSVNGNFEYFPLSFNRVSDNTYEVDVNIPSCGFVKVSICFKTDKIDVTIDMDKHFICADYTYLISSDVVKKIESIRRDNRLVHYKNEDLESISLVDSDIVTFDSNTPLKWFKLPWGAYYGINNTIDEISESEKIIQIYNMYFEMWKDRFFKKEFYSKTYRRNEVASAFGNSVVLDEMIKDTRGIRLSKKDKVYLIETTFLDSLHSNGYYDEKLERKFFYHLYQSDDINKIDVSGIVLVTPDGGVLENADLLNDSLTLKLVRGE